MEAKGRGNFGSQLGVILASAGSAVGLGNVWRFPTEVGRNGGAAFILVYLCFVFMLALPVMVSEFVVGRSAGTNALHAYHKLSGTRRWTVPGILGVLGGLIVLSYYSVVAGWTLYYVFESLASGFQPGMDYHAHFQSFVSSPWQPLMYLIGFLLITHFVVKRGINRGIERASKLMMPVLFLVMVALIGCSLTMPGSKEGLLFLLKPDFSKLNAQVVLSAMGQAFFSLSVGLGCLTTYASYFKKDTRLVHTALSVCSIDTMVAVLSGFFIFPAVFSVSNVSPDTGPGLVFVTLPYVFDVAFSAVPWLGYIFSGMFYVLLLLAALTSSISMHEICTAFILEHFHLTRKTATTIVTVLCILLGTSCSLSFGNWSGVSIFGMNIFDFFDFLTAKCFMPVGAVLGTVFVGWYLPRKLVNEELTNRGTLRVKALPFLLFLIRWVAPICVTVIFINGLFMKG